MMHFKTIQSITELSSQYDAFLIDLWGVIHDGTQMYDGAATALAHLHAAGKPVAFLSNAPRKAALAEAVLTQLGVPRAHYAHIVTSGQVAHDRLAVTRQWGERYYYLGPSKDEEILSDLKEYQSVEAEKAEFILNAGFEYDYQAPAEIIPTLEKLFALQLPLLCINPDLEVVKQDGSRMLCAGWVAQEYDRMGGHVIYIGKPYPQVYEAALEQLGKPDPERVLAIGDNFHTDIRGANNMGIDSLLITGGILKSEHGDHPSDAALQQLSEEAEAIPTYIAQSFTA